MKSQHECVLHPPVLAQICQIQAIAESATAAASDLERHEMVAIGQALTQASIDISDRLGWLDTFGPGRGRAA